MCTLVLAWQVFDDTPIAVAANRDEALGRPAEPPGIYREGPRVIAPCDVSAGGTWIGYNAEGLFVGITNRWVDRDGERSRGQLVADCLAEPSAAAAVEGVRRAVRTDRYAGFNLTVADAERAVFLAYDGGLSVTDFDPGVHVVVNVGADGEGFEPAGRPAVGRQQAAHASDLRAALAPAADETASAWLDRAAGALGDHAYGVCVHGEGFGTRSASLLALEATADGAVGRYWFADGPPCRTAFERVEPDR